MEIVDGGMVTSGWPYKVQTVPLTIIGLNGDLCAFVQNRPLVFIRPHTRLGSPEPIESSSE